MFIFGLGYSALEIAKAAKAFGFSVSGTTRSAEKCELLRAQGIQAYVLDSRFRGNDDLEHATHILSSVPTVEGQGDVVIPHLDLASAALRVRLRGNDGVWLGYLSTTGVYGDWGGAWVDEASETRPNNARLERRVAAEAAWRERGAHVFRLAGIYGPGRSAVDDVMEGSARRIDKPGQVFSRIHVEDIAQAVVASMKHPNPGRIYNVCDDLPAPQAEVVEYACGLLGKEPPPVLTLEQANLSAMGREFYSANRRVRNERIKHELDVTLRYPTYREGLAAIAKLGKLV